MLRHEVRWNSHNKRDSGIKDVNQQCYNSRHKSFVRICSSFPVSTLVRKIDKLKHEKEETYMSQLIPDESAC